MSEVTLAGILGFLAGAAYAIYKKVKERRHGRPSGDVRNGGEC
jgi:hypothetical protein